MIVVKLKGRLGNQIFQYAIGRHLALMNNTSLKFDISGYKGVRASHLKLNAFGIDIKKANLFDKLLSKKYEEQSLDFDNNVLDSTGNIYLDGYWQSEQYFISIADVIRSDIELRDTLSSANLEMLRQISETDSVSIHIRRGDYVTHDCVTKTLGACSLDYYIAAVDYVVDRISNPNFFVFSDDTEWVSDNFKIDYPMTIVDINGAETAYIDLYLMSRCKNQIISNSSFSWWGAWLNNNPGKIVVAPYPWYNDKNMNSEDIIPDSWHKITK